MKINKFSWLDLFSLDVLEKCSNFKVPNATTIRIRGSIISTPVNTSSALNSLKMLIRLEVFTLRKNCQICNLCQKMSAKSFNS